MSAADKKELSEYLTFRLRPISDELTGSGAGHVLACYIPAGASMKVLCDQDDRTAAEMCEVMAEGLLRHAAELRKKTASATGSIIMPEGFKAS